MHQSPLLSPNTSTFALPASSEHEWRFSYQFATSEANLVRRVALGVGVLALVIVAVKASW